MKFMSVLAHVLLVAKRHQNNEKYFMLLSLYKRNASTIYTVNPGLVSMNYIFRERNLIYLHGEDKV